MRLYRQDAAQDSIEWLLEALRFYAPEAFKSVETVLVDMDYKEIRTIEKLMPDARILPCEVHAIQAFRKYVRSKRRYADGPVKLFK